MAVLLQRAVLSPSSRCQYNADTQQKNGGEIDVQSERSQ